MYRPTVFQEDDLGKLIAFIKANSFALLVSICDGIPCVSHIPSNIQPFTPKLK
jgi:transcriptional regulator